MCRKLESTGRRPSTDPSPRLSRHHFSFADNLAPIASELSIIILHPSYPSSAHASSASRSTIARSASGIADNVRGVSASNSTGSRISGRPSSSSSSSLSISRSRYPARRAALISMGFGRENIDCPDLDTKCELAEPNAMTTVYSLSHHRGETAELQHVPCNQQECVKKLLLLAGRAALCECEYKQRQCAEYRQNEIDDVEWGFPELLHGDRIVQAR